MHLRVTEDYGLIPIEDEAVKYLYKKKVGDILDCDVVKKQNYEFHKKLFALFNTIHEALPEPEPIMYNDELIQPVRTFDDTRKYLTIMAGHYDVIGLPNGKTRVEAKSIAYDKMDADEREDFYSRVIDAGLKVLPDTWTEEELNRVAMEIINFA